MAKILVLYYSMYGHTETMAKAAAEGAGGVEGTEVVVKRVPELVPEDIARKAGAKLDQAAPGWRQVDELPNYDAVIFGTPTRFGGMCAQMRNFLDQTGRLWAGGKLIGKVGSVFTSTATQHGGQETTLTSFHTTLLHHGMIIGGGSVFLQRTHKHERNHRRNPLWSEHSCRRGRESSAVGE